MRIFLSYATQDRYVAEWVLLALRAQDHTVFFDRSDLPPGEEYDTRIREAIQKADLFVFLITPDTVDAGSYTLTELDIAEKTWKHPGGRVLPVMVRPVDMSTLPAVLRAVTVLQPEGNIPAAVADAVARIAQARWRRRRNALLAAAAAIAAVATGLYVYAPDLRRTLATQEITGKDGAPAVMIPAGVFTMGDGEETPARDIHLDRFYMDKYEVSLARYAAFLKATGGRANPDYWSMEDAATHGDRPVIGVTWHDADAYCRWAGKRLPTEAEWEKAARGTDGRSYPWGKQEPDSKLANFGKSDSLPWKEGLLPVASHEPGKSPYGMHNLAGNASEWTADWYGEDFPRSAGPNPKGPASGKGRVLRGGGWDDPARALLSAKRYYDNPDASADDRGFRCAKDAPK